MTVGEHGLAVHRVTASVMAERAAALLGERLGQGARPEQLAVLARVNSALLPVQVALTEAGVAHTAPLDATVLGRTGVRTALAYLRAGLDLERIRREDLFDTINRPARKVKSAVQPLLGRRSRFSIAQLDQVADGLGQTHRDRFHDYLSDLRSIEAAITDQADTARCLWLVRNRIGLGEAMDALDASRSRPEGSSHGDDLDALEQLAALQPDPAAFRDWLAERLRVPGDPAGVTLSTVHRVKGMEWDHVLVFAANQGLFPHRLSDDVEEERRVFHVALTRGRRHVDVIADRARTTPFADELYTAAEPSRSAGGPSGAHPRDFRSEANRSTPPATGVAATRAEPDGPVIAVAGLRVTVAGGFDGVVGSVNTDHSVVVLDARGVGAGVTVRVPFGQPVTVEGARTSLIRAARRRASGGRASEGGPGSARLGDTGDAPPVDDVLYEALRGWRSRIAAESGIPAYLIFHDRHLQVIAGRKPNSLHELARCPGVGPTKLDRYGDDVLDLVAGHDS